MNIKDFHYKNISIGLNYGTAKTENEDVIYIEIEGNCVGDSNIIAVTAEEAEVIAKELLRFVEMFK